jgi:UDP-N-acetylglucosamine--dolichyl-phosphate N-acetylglucosaminephosphotransferase
MGGAAVLVGFYIGVSFLAIFGSEDILAPLYNAALLAVLGAGFVGILDDLFAIRRRYKALIPFLLSLPLGIVVFLRGDTDLFGFNVGTLMVFLVPFGVTSAANAANMLEGFNGLGAGLGIIMASSLIVLSFALGAQEGLFLLVPLLGALLAFLWYNRYPARVFPGDSMTLSVGAAVACAAIISQPSFKTYGFLLFIPMIAEFFLKARGRFRGENYGSVGSDGRLTYRGRVESLAHLIMRRGRYREWQVVAILWAAEAAIAVALLVTVAQIGPP